MHNMILPVFPIVAVSVAFLFALIATPIARRLALAIGLMDHPDTHRKLHREPIALCGGIAILFSLLGTLVVCLMAYPAFVSISMGHMYEAMSLALGAVAIVLLGVLDDRFGLRGRQNWRGKLSFVCRSSLLALPSIQSAYLDGEPRDTRNRMFL